MDPADPFGADPQVQGMRRIFAEMETAQTGLMDSLNLSTFDPRLRRIRAHALRLFERNWVAATRQGILADANEAATLYVLCLAHALRGNRIDVPPEALPKHPRIEKFIKESMQ